MVLEVFALCWKHYLIKVIALKDRRALSVHRTKLTEFYELPSYRGWRVYKWWMDWCLILTTQCAFKSHSPKHTHSIHIQCFYLYLRTNSDECTVVNSEFSILTKDPFPQAAASCMTQKSLQIGRWSTQHLPHVLLRSQRLRLVFFNTWVKGSN